MDHQDGPIDLQPLLGVIQLQINLVIPDRCPKFRLVIEHVIVVPHFAYSGMIARDGRTIDSDLAFIPTAHPNPLLWDVLNAQQGKSLDVDLFKDEMLSLWHLNRHQLVHLASFFYQLRVLVLTHLTGKLLKVVIRQTFHLILLYFWLVPFLKAVEVHQSAGTRALARTAEELSLLFSLLHHAVLAFSLLYLIRDLDLLVTVQNVIH